MAIPILSLTDSDQVRAALGLSSRDVDDQFFIDRKADRELRLALFEWFPNYASEYSSWTTNASANQEKIDLLESYATYQTAYIISSGLSMMALQKVSDSKFTAARFEGIDLDSISELMRSKANQLKTRLQEVLGTAHDGPVNLFSSVAPSYDPVTGE